jgi:FkbM family methyltransferase
MAKANAPRKNWLKSALVRLTSSDIGQQFLERHVQFMLELMGIGSGSSPSWSGEKGLGRLLRERYLASGSPLCIFDVGANIGQFLEEVIQPLAAARIPLLAHAFEPSRQSYEMLEQTFKDHPDFSLNNCALGEAAGEAELYAPAAGSSLSSFSRRRLDHFGLTFDQSEKVKVRTLDEYCWEKSIEAIDLLKLDVEGHELDVMQGGARMFRERRIAIVSFEFGGADIDSRTFLQDFWYFLRDNGAGSLHRLTPSGRLIPILGYKEIYEQFRPTIFVVLQTEA